MNILSRIVSDLTKLIDNDTFRLRLTDIHDSRKGKPRKSACELYKGKF